LSKQVTVEGTKNVLAAAKQAKVGRFVHIGTEAVLVHSSQPIIKADETTPDAAATILRALH